jgi:uncharacterized protein (TIGR03437 family)
MQVSVHLRIRYRAALFLLGLTGPLLAATVSDLRLTEVGTFQALPICSPPPSITIFQTTSTKIYAFLLLDNYNISDKNVVVVEWFDPGGKLARSLQFPPLPPLPIPITSTCFFAPLTAPDIPRHLNLTPGTWNAQVRLNDSVAARVSFQITVGDPLIEGIVPATFVPGAVPAGGFMTIAGRGFCTSGSSQQAIQTPWPTSLAGAFLLVDGEPAPLFFVGETFTGCQINAQLPWTAVEGPHQVRVRFTYGNSVGLSGPTTFQAAAVNPSFFSAPPQYPVFLQIADRASIMMTISNPVYPGETLVGYADGFGQTSPPRLTGSPAPVASGRFANVAEPVAASLKACIGIQCTSVPATVVYAIAYPASPAAYQVAFTLPQVTVDASTQYSLVVQIGGKSAPDMPLYLTSRP